MYIERINKQLQFIYNDKVAQNLIPIIQTKIEQIKKRVLPSPKALSEQDLFLITYADQFSDHKILPLEAHTKFYKTYLEDIINSVHFLPFFPASSDGGFSVIDYKKVDSKIGNWDQVNNFCENPMFDSVFNHISAESNWFKEWLKCNSKYEDYFIHFSKDEYDSKDFQEKLNMVTRPRTSPLLTPFTRQDGSVRYVWTTFSADQIDLNFSNPEVLVEIIDFMLFYFEQGATTLRIDAIPFYWKEIGTNSMHHEKTHAIVKLFRAIANEINPNYILITESNVPHQENISYWGENDDEANLVYNFTLAPLLIDGFYQQSAKYLHNWSKDLKTPKSNTFFNITATHDGIGIRPAEGILTSEQIDHLATKCKERGGFVGLRTVNEMQRPYELNISWSSALYDPMESLEDNVQKLVSSQLIMASLPGVPAFYIHSFLATLNNNGGVEKSKVWRDINRKRFSLSEVTQKLTQDGLTKSVYRELTRCLTIRKKYQAFHPYAAKEDVDLHPQIWSFFRTNYDERILTLLNLSSKSIKIDLEEKIKISSYEDLLNTQEGQKIVNLKPYEIKWLKI